LDPAFLAWALRSDFMREQFANRATGVTRYGLTYGAIQGASVPLAGDIAAQRRIAGFLDDQVALIDRAVAARRVELDLINVRRRAITESVLQPATLVPLRRLVMDVRVGIVIQPAALYVEDVEAGVPALRGTDVREGWIDTSAPGAHLSCWSRRESPIATAGR
jgi:hypothetical protein